MALFIMAHGISTHLLVALRVLIIALVKTMSKLQLVFAAQTNDIIIMARRKGTIVLVYDCDSITLQFCPGQLKMMLEQACI